MTGSQDLEVLSGPKEYDYVPGYYAALAEPVECDGVSRAVKSAPPKASVAALTAPRGQVRALAFAGCSCSDGVRTTLGCGATSASQTVY